VRHRIWKYIVVAAVASVGIVRTAAAQSTHELPVGTRIRVGLPDSLRAYSMVRRGQWIAGTLVRATPDTLVLHVGGANPFYVARRDVTELSVSEGASRVRSAADHGFWGGLFCALATNSVENAQGSVHARDVALGAAYGVAVGALFGALSPFEHWRKVRH
jgi:hypothetical protein